MSMRNLTLLLLVFMLALMCIKKARASDYSECVNYLDNVDNSRLSTLPNAPNYSGTTPFNKEAIPPYCTCMVLSKEQGRVIDLTVITECQALSGLLSILEV